MTRFWYWDEINGELSSIDVEIPDGCTPRQALVLADDAISTMVEGDDPEDGTGTHNKKLRQEGDVFVLDALFGQDKVTRVYYCPEGDDLQARKVAEAELEKFLEEE